MKRREGNGLDHRSHREPPCRPALHAGPPQHDAQEGADSRREIQGGSDLMKFDHFADLGDRVRV
jgi:hypothetical protein